MTSAPLYLIETSPWNAANAATVDLYLAGGGTKPYLGRLGRDDWRGGVVGRPLVTSAVGFDQNGWGTGALPNVSTMQFAPADTALLSSLAAYNWANAPIKVSVGDDTLAAPTITTELLGYVQDITIKGGVVTFTIVDLSNDLTRPVLLDRFAGTGGVEGDSDVAQRIKRRTWGRAFNVEGFVLLKAANVYEFGHPSYGCQQFDAVKDKGREASSYQYIGWQGTMSATLAALVASTPAAGGCTVCPSLALVKWWTQPSGPLTADIRGEYAGGYVETAPEIAQRVVNARSTIVVANAGAMAGIRPGAAGLHIKDETETIGQAIDRVLNGVGLGWTVEAAGNLRMAPFVFDATGAETITTQECGRDAVFKPVRSRRLGFGRNHRLHTDGEISAAVLASDVTGLGNLATLNKISFGDPVLTESDGTTIAVDAKYKTSLGRADTINNQGPGATGTAREVLNDYLAGNVLTVTRPGGGEYAYGGTIGGRLKIRLPTKNVYSMVTFDVNIYNYVTGTSVTFKIGGYVYNGADERIWYNVGASFIGPQSRAFPVAFGFDGSGYPAVSIGTDDSVWDYPQVTVRNVQVGYSHTAAAYWATGWLLQLFGGGLAVEFTSVPKPRAGDAVFGEGIYESAAGIAATLAAFKTALGQADTIKYQAPTATNSDFDAVTGANKPANNAGTSGLLVPIGSYTFVRGNSVFKTGGTHGLHEGGAVGAPQQGGAFIGGSIISAAYGGGWETWFALDTNPTTYDVASQKITARCVASPAGQGVFVIGFNGVDQAAAGPFTIDGATRWRLVCDNVAAWIEVNGIIGVGKVPIPAPLGQLFPKVLDFYNNGTTPGYILTDVLYGSYGDITAQQQVTIAWTVTDKDIPFDSSGTTTTALPATIAAPKVTRGGQDITTGNGTSHTIQNASAGLPVTVNNTVGSASKGVATIGTGFSASGSYEHVVTVDGKAQPAQKVTVNLKRATSNAGGGGGGGGGSGNTGSFGSGPLAADGGQVVVGQVNGIVVASGKTLKCQFGDDFYISRATNSNGSAKAQGHWEYSPTGANSWTALGGNVASAQNATYAWVSGDQTPATLIVNQNVAPAAGTYDARFLAGLTANLPNGNAYFAGGGGGSVDATT